MQFLLLQITCCVQVEFRLSRCLVSKVSKQISSFKMQNISPNHYLSPLLVKSTKLANCAHFHRGEKSNSVISYDNCSFAESELLKSEPTAYILVKINGLKHGI